MRPVDWKENPFLLCRLMRRTHRRLQQTVGFHRFLVREAHSCPDPVHPAWLASLHVTHRLVVRRHERLKARYARLKLLHEALPWWCR